MTKKNILLSILSSPYTKMEKHDYVFDGTYHTVTWTKGLGLKFLGVRLGFRI